MTRTRRAVVAVALATLLSAVAVPLAGSSAVASPRLGGHAPTPRLTHMVQQRLRQLLLHAHTVPYSVSKSVHGIDGAPAQDKSYNWSGYFDAPAKADTFTHVAASWIQPKITCPNEFQLAAFWVGLDGVTSDTVEQDGTLAACEGGTAYYYTWWEMYPTVDIQFVGSTVLPGDSITAAVTYHPATKKYSLTVTDATTKHNNVSETEACSSTVVCANTSAEWITEAPGTSRGESPLAHYGSFAMTHSTATQSNESSPGHISSFSDADVTMVGDLGYALSTAGALNSVGGAFTFTWKNSY